MYLSELDYRFLARFMFFMRFLSSYLNILKRICLESKQSNSKTIPKDGYLIWRARPD